MKRTCRSTLWNNYPRALYARKTPWRASVSLLLTVFVVVGGIFAAPFSEPRADPLLTYPIQVGKHHIRVELANSADTRRQGLMFRQRLAPGSGMIFVFPREQRLSMWMKNTSIPLSVAFIDSHGRILNIAKMQPLSEATHSSKGPARYALEANQGWFESRGIKPGDTVSGLEHLPPPK